jgi:aminopeptidase N/puromycin-sensitive aminopeptidase
MSMLRNRDTADQTWSYLKQNWDKVRAQLTTFSGGGLVAATNSFCSAEKRDDVNHFFSTHKVMAAERTLQQATDSINGCIQLHEAQEPNLKRWLVAKGAGVSASGQ